MLDPGSGYMLSSNNQDELVIGRSPDCDTVGHDPTLNCNGEELWVDEQCISVTEEQELVGQFDDTGAQLYETVIVGYKPCLRCDSFPGDN